MSDAHKDAFESIKDEHRVVTDLLKYASEKSRKAKTGRNPTLSSLPSVDPTLIETAIATANDAYALLLIATAEKFMRTYLIGQSVRLDDNPKLETLIYKCRKEFNKTTPRIRIHPDAVRDMIDLKEKRNQYAHGRASSVFPSIGRVVALLGKFFDQLP